MLTRIYETTGHAFSLELAKTMVYEMNLAELDDDDAWEYKVEGIANGLAYITVYDEEGVRLGAL